MAAMTMMPNVLLDLAEGVDAVVDTIALLDQQLPDNDMLIVRVRLVTAAMAEERSL
jgi:hypothetical protein